MKILYIFPHPDDESFGPAHVMSKQRREGHEVYLLTLTKGGATRQRHKYNYSVEKMGEVRFQEMQNVAKTIGLTNLKVLDLPDSGLKAMDPREIEKVVEEEIGRVKPEVVVTYPVHGISGFHDHIICHGIVKRAFVALKNKCAFLKRLAFYSLREEEAKDGYFPLSGSTTEEIDCVVEVEEEDMENAWAALDCYVTFQETIEKTNIKNLLPRKAVFEFFREDHDPPLTDLFASLD